MSARTTDAKMHAKDKFAIVVAVIALLISLWNLAFMHLWPIGIEIVRENETRLANINGVGAFNSTFVVFGRGTPFKHAALKISGATVTTAEGKAYSAKASSNLKEDAHTQSNTSRNLPLSIRGGSDAVLTIGFEPEDRSFQWHTGRYKISFAATELRTGNRIQAGDADITLTPSNVEIINKGILMLPTN